MHGMEWECRGHESIEGPMGVLVYCDGSCGPPERPTGGDAITCTRCGARITDVEHDDNGGCCAECAADLA